MADEEPKKLDEVVLNPESLPESLREKFAGKSVSDVLKSYEESQKLAHDKSEQAAQRERELEELRLAAEAENASGGEDPVSEDEKDYDSLFGDDEYVTKDSVDKRISAIEKKYEKKFQDIEESAVQKAMAQMEKKSFIEGHPELFEGKSEGETNAMIKKIAGAGFIAGKQSLEGGLQAIREMAGEIGMNNEQEQYRGVPQDIPQKLGEYDNPADEVEHMKKVHKETRGNISSFLK